ncbi:alpha/beta hydrolase [Marinifilum caeruleilacunae]|uniref:Alpha/beta hydrolase n=1 Tax=Marinifilum caeruleilacunae TaxID=2499076 RepID=A0ABX1WXI7_9BACT|nr:alpha/beta hydrolase-fold protein [Marinifilum caeruleilacunae]NOU60711.1 alpha/beta hydrolase [Marinifilum caeruleilacunae]
MKGRILFLLLILTSTAVLAQKDSCAITIKKHIINSKFLDQDREVWVALPKTYESGKKYPVLYVLDAEWHFDLIRVLSNNLAKSKKIPEHIVVGIPHVSVSKERVKDFTFSLSNVNPYGKKQLPKFFNEANCGGGIPFFSFLNQEVVQCIDSCYTTNNNNVLLAHSLAGYFASYTLSRNHKFTAIQIYDPSIWYNNGEAIEQIKDVEFLNNGVKVFMANQIFPNFHYQNMNKFAIVLRECKHVDFKQVEFSDENHGSVYLDGFLKGIDHLYKDYKLEHFKLKK